MNCSPVPALDRKSGSAGMPRSTLFPYTPLFRSLDPLLHLADTGDAVTRRRALVDERTRLRDELLARAGVRSEERVSRNAEIYTLPLHAALPISRPSPSSCGYWRRRHSTSRAGRRTDASPR